MKQTSFFSAKIPPTFGGSQMSGRKVARTLSTKNPIHLVLKSQAVLANGSFVKHRRLVESTFHKTAKKWGIRIYEQAVNRDHLHLVIRIRTRRAYNQFIQAVTGILAKKLNPSPGVKFWLYRPFTRICSWGRAYRRLCTYVSMNQHEADGEIPYQSREKKRRKTAEERAEIASMGEFIDELIQWRYR